MAIEVTEEMVQAARRLLPARWSMQDLHNAIQAAIEAWPRLELAFEFPTDPDDPRYAEMMEQILAPGRLLPLGSCVPSEVVRGTGLVDPAECPHRRRITEDGVNAACEACGADVPAVELDSVDLAPAPGPVELGGVSEIADRYGVARSTVNGWIKRAEKIGMPPPLAILAAGPVYNLTVLDPWYAAWKEAEGAAA